MVDIEKLAEKIMEYQADIDWYGLCDDYGNIETDEESRKVVFEEIYNSLQTNPDEILNVLNGNLEEMELEDDYQEQEDYKKTKEIIEEIEELKTQSLEDEMEM